MNKLEKDKLLKIILKTQRNHNKPDLHSFTAKIKDGNVYVEGHDDGIYVEYYIGKNKYQYHALPVTIYNLLIKLKIDLKTIEM